MRKVQVLLSSYNGEKFVLEQLDSIINQSGVDVNILVRDDGSTDRTVEIIENINNNKIKLLKSNNIGATKSFFDLIENADDMDFYAFSDQDDFWESQKLKIAIEKMEKFQDVPAIYSSNTILVDQNLKYIKKEDKKVITTLGSAIVKNYVTGCTTVFNKKTMELLKKSTGIDVPFHDWWINLVVLSTGGVSIFDSNSYIKYRQHDSNVVGGSKNFIEKWKNRIKKYNKPYQRDKMAKYLIDIYGDSINDENKAILDVMSNYKNNKYRIFFSKTIRTSNFFDNILFLICTLNNKL